MTGLFALRFSKKSVENLESSIRLDKPRAETKHVGMVMLACQFCSHVAPNNCGADALKSVCGDRHADAGSADQDAKVDVPALNTLRNFCCSVGIIVRLFVLGADLTDCMALVDRPG